MPMLETQYGIDAPKSGLWAKALVFLYCMRNGLLIQVGISSLCGETIELGEYVFWSQMRNQPLRSDEVSDRVAIQSAILLLPCM